MDPLRRRSHPSLLEIPSRPWLIELSVEAGRPVGLGDVPESALAAVVEGGYDAVWLMGVWTTGPKARELALAHPDLRAAYDRLLPRWSPSDVAGSPYSIATYDPPPAWGGREGLRRLRHRLNERGVALILDFVPNHMGVDHAWLDHHPELLVRGTSSDLESGSANWFRHETSRGEERIFAHGRDPHFEGWSDTVQIDYRRRAARAAMKDLLIDVASLADGLRCDMAMLLLDDVFRGTWGDAFPEEAGDFWTEAIPAARSRHPDLALIAEVYWGLEGRLLDLGFDWAYDKELLDRLAVGEPGPVQAWVARDHLHHERRVHFLENHDEERAWSVFGPARSAAAAVTLYTLPGLRFFHLGQTRGYRLRVPVQLARYPEEPDAEAARALYDAVLDAVRDPALRTGDWRPEAFEDVTEGSAIGLVGSRWTGGEHIWIAGGNFGSRQARARVRLPVKEQGPALAIADELRGESFERDRKEVAELGLYVEVPAGEACLLRCPREAEV